LKDGDRVVWIGSTLVEREQRYGYWETALHAAFPKANFTFRNLGWSGDTVFGDSRAGFETPKEGFKRLVGLTLELKPTVILISYGANESFAGEAGLPKFEKGLEALLDALAPAKARVVLFTPLRIRWGMFDEERMDRSKSQSLAAYRSAIETVAKRRSLRIANLTDVGFTSKEPISENGIHLNEFGYELTARLFLDGLGVQSHPGIQPTPFRGDPQLLRTAIRKKNELFFHRWRPQNETYLFGFRKHEQGKNAKEVAEFDPLVDAAEKEIARIKADLLK
jgi:hypothetical protein